MIGLSVQKMTRTLVSISIMTAAQFAFAVPSTAQDSPEPTSASIKNEDLRIDYRDYNSLLDVIVFEKRDRSRALPKSKAAPTTGSRISWVNKKNTRMESNRVLFHLIGDDQKTYIKRMLDSLAAIPGEFSLDIFSEDEQLAYWLNLRNLMVIDLIAERYPIAKLKTFWRRYGDVERVTIDGKPMSVMDVENYILETWPRVEVIYGLYDGTIGGPNLRGFAFTGTNVWGALANNADEFVNSLRGVQFSRKTTKVSDFYKRYPAFFPNLKEDVKSHVRDNLNTDLMVQMDATEKLSLSISDTSIADVLNGGRGPRSAAPLSPAGLIFARIEGSAPGGDGAGAGMQASSSNALSNFGSAGGYTGSLRYPGHVLAYLTEMKKRISEATGVVTLEEVENTDEKDNQ